MYEEAERIGALDTITLPYSLRRAAMKGFSALRVDQRYLHALLGGGQVSDDLVYSAIAAVAAEHPQHANSFAVISPLAYTRWVDGDRDIDKPYEMVSDSRFWQHDRILVPIYRERHWMAACVVLGLSQVYFYDSFAQQHQGELHGEVSDLRACV